MNLQEEYVKMYNETFGVPARRELPAPNVVGAPESQPHSGALGVAPRSRPEKPRRRVQLKLSLGADNRDELMRALDQIVLELQMGHLWGESASGGCGSGYHMSVSEDASITHESYFEAIRAQSSANANVQRRSGDEPASPSVLQPTDQPPAPERSL